MTISLQVPDALAKALHLDGPQLNRRALEALALDGYRTGESLVSKIIAEV
jgi:hypothetical protein